MVLTDKDIIIDVETACDIDIAKVGAYGYATHHSLRLLLLSFTIGESETVWTFDVASGEPLSEGFINVLLDPEYRKHAHNAVFEILVLENHLKRKLDVRQWYCSMAASAYCGLPLALKDVAITLAHDYKKQTSGAALIKKFSVPNKNGTYTAPAESPSDWAEFIKYNKIDVLTERENLRCMPEIPEIFRSGTERDVWLLDYRINTTGIKVDVGLANNADLMCEREDEEMIASIRGSGIDNLNSRKQVLEFLSSRGYEVTSLRADDYANYLSDLEKDKLATAVLKVKQQLSKTSASKFKRFVESNVNGYIYGTLQYYGAVQTGRWSGRGAQPQNLKKNELEFEYLNFLRTLVKEGDYDSVKTYFTNVKDAITELGRTIIVPEEGNAFYVTDFSAIEARVTAWIAKENWRLDVFRTHGKIYEASAALMFKVPIDSIGRGSLERTKGKFAELALGYGGWLGAFKAFGADKFMSDKEMIDVAKSWRQANKNIVSCWADVEECAVSAVRDFGEPKTTRFGVEWRGIEHKGRRWLTCRLPSGRHLFYYDPKLRPGRNGSLTFSYRRLNKESDVWYGGLTENVVQAIARDLLAEKMLILWREHSIVPTIHVHDEIVIEAPEDDTGKWESLLSEVMARPVEWAEGLPLNGDSNKLPFYMKAD